MVCLNKANKLTIAGGITPTHTSHHSTGVGYSKLPNLTKLAKGTVTSLIILSTIISLCTPILSITIPSVNNTVLEANGIDTSSTASNQTNGSNGITTNDVDPTTMASDLESLNNALETQAEGEGISINLSSPTNFTITPDNLSTGTGNATNIAATSITANVKTAMPGYSLTIQQAANTTTTNNTNIANPNGSLINPANPSNSPILSTDGTPDFPKALSNNEWGYAISGSNNFDTSYTTGNTNSLTSKWAKVPTSTETAQTIKTTEDTPPTEGDNTTVYYGVNVPKNKTAGQYQTTITYTATANILDPPEVEKVEPSSIRQSLQMTACYVTTAGSVYCTGPTGVTQSESNEGPNYTYNYDYNKESWMSNLAPVATSELSGNLGPLSVQSYSPVVALTDSESTDGPLVSPLMVLLVRNIFTI